MIATIQPDVLNIRPQPRQEEFLSSPADIVIYGGAAFGGKTFSLLIEPLRHINNPDFGAVIFRRTIPEITREGGLWDEAGNIYPLLNARPNSNEHIYRFPSGAKISFAHMQYENDKYSWKSAQIALIEWDQLETFTESQFFYMLSRNRSMSGIRPYMRATCNPEPGWLANLLQWWIDEDGYAIPERSGVIRWFVRENDTIYWANSAQDLNNDHSSSIPKSLTFILSTIYDNKIGMAHDPGYLSNLQALPYIERERLLGDAERGGNWKIKPEAGKIFNRAWFEIVPAVPAGGHELRFYDLAASKKKQKSDDPDFTASIKGKIVEGVTYILHMTNERIGPAETDMEMKNRASQDGKAVSIRFEKEGGASGERDAQHIVKNLAGYDIIGIRPQGDKIARAQPLAAQAFAGNVKLLAGDWNEEFLTHMHGQPDLPHDDIMDAASGMYNSLVNLPLDWGGMKNLGKVKKYKSRWTEE